VADSDILFVFMLFEFDFVVVIPAMIFACGVVFWATVRACFIAIISVLT